MTDKKQEKSWPIVAFCLIKSWLLLNWKRADCIKNRLSHRIISLRGFPRYSKTCLWINWIPKIMVRFCYLRLLYLGIEMELKLENGANSFKFQCNACKDRSSINCSSRPCTPRGCPIYSSQSGEQSWRAVSGSACFKLRKQTWRRKKQWYKEDDFSKSTL